jgi:NADPH2:quinone reductase
MLPAVAGIDGVGETERGLVYFGQVRRPFGAIAELAPANATFTIPVTVEIDPAVAAAVPNAAMSTLLPLRHLVKLEPGESVMVLGATGFSGRMAIAIARHLGAGRVIAVGRNAHALESTGADATVVLGDDETTLAGYAAALGDGLPDVILDYLYGKPAELLFRALLMRGRLDDTWRPRYVQIGSMAGETVTVPASFLRATGMTITGSGWGSVSMADIVSTIPQAWELAASGVLEVPVERVPLAEAAEAWRRGDRDGRRLVITMDGSGESGSPAAG